ncbi:MAG: hypothetical protein AB1578_18150 [Thermodesulfobacteriota bacterium]
MAGHGAKIGRKQEQAIAALLSEPTIERAAAAVGADPRTLRRWMQRDDFREAYRLARRELMDCATARIQSASCAAVDALEEILGDSGAPAGSRVSAAKGVLELAVKVAELQDLQERIERLEAAANAAGKGIL